MATYINLALFPRRPHHIPEDVRLKSAAGVTSSANTAAPPRPPAAHLPNFYCNYCCMAPSDVAALNRKATEAELALNEESQGVQCVQGEMAATKKNRGSSKYMVI